MKIQSYLHGRMEFQNFAMFKFRLFCCVILSPFRLYCVWFLSHSGLDFSTILSFSSLVFMVIWFSLPRGQILLLYDCIIVQTLYVCLLFSGLDFKTVLSFWGLDFNTVLSRLYSCVICFLSFSGRGAGGETVHVQILARLPGAAQLRHLPSTTAPPGHGLVQTERQGARHHPLHVSASCQTKIS